ncbi:MAG: 50S ribosomal protein L11 methyltransferase [Planctomycetes bacterium]|nr:50S ribosomal protein L11 methyltransferase [Planctomycetota bacterium]
MQYYCLHYIISHGTEEQFSVICSAQNFYNYVVSSRTDGMEDAALYCVSAAEADRMCRALEVLSVTLAERKTMSEEALLARHNPLAPINLTERVCLFPEEIPVQHDFELGLHMPPGPAFGDGHHPSTQMAARLLDLCEFKNQRVLDMGCGTGVLGLIAEKRGATHVDFSDIDADSVRFTQDVCALNNYSQAYVFASDLLEHCDRVYDVIIANIYADLLFVLFDDPALDTALPQGRCIVSGISYQRIDEVQALVKAKGFTIEQHIEQEWWHAMLLSR